MNLVFGILCIALIIVSVKLEMYISSNTISSHKFNSKRIVQNASLSIAAMGNEPFLVWNKNGQPFGGIDFELIKLMGDRERLKVLSFEQYNQRHQFNQTDILVGGIFPNISHLDSFTMSSAYFQDDFTWCVQRSGFYSPVVNFFMIATPECFVLIIFGVGYFTGILLYIIIQFDYEYKYRNQHDWHYTTLIIMLPAVIGVNQRYHPQHFALKLLYFVIIASCFAHWQIFFYQLIRFFMVPVRFHQIATLDEIIEGNFRLSGSFEVRTLISFDARYKQEQLSSFYACETIDSCLEELKRDNYNLAVGGSRQHILNNPLYSPTEIFCFDGKIASFQSTLLVKKDFHLRPKINRIVRYAFEGGLFVKWANKYQRKKRERPVETNHALTLVDFSPAFVFLTITGSMLAVASFCAEHFINKKLLQQPQSYVWKVLGRFFDGKRY